MLTSRSRAGVADRERVVGQHAVALAVADLDADDDAIDRREGLLHLQPAETAAARRVLAARVLDHQALVAARAGVDERSLDGVGVGRDHEVRPGETAAIGRRAGASSAVERARAARRAARAAAARPAAPSPGPRASTSKAT